MSKILIVDDNEDVLPIMQMLLSSQGFEVEVTTNGEQTFELVDRFQPSLIFIDVQLAGIDGIDGIDISRQLKTAEKTKHIWIILVSADIIKPAALSQSLADEFIAKPFDIQELLLKVHKLIGSPD
jgi:Response regulators consisting of a CheY-like receiver domain and a winged-helix DNA-binding domain